MSLDYHHIVHINYEQIVLIYNNYIEDLNKFVIELSKQYIALYLITIR